MITIGFEFNSEFGIYRDAIVLPDQHTYTIAEIEDMKQARFAAWLEILRKPQLVESINNG